MPIYEYSCGACGHQEGVVRRGGEPQLTECPVCRKPTFRKMLSAAGFQLKGSGWYATDFRSKPGKPAEKKADEKSDTKTDTKPDSKPETKPEKKTDAKSEAAA